MPRKKKKKTFSAGQVVREMARERVGAPKPSQRLVEKKRKPEKYKVTLPRLMEE
jgi:hypothetical protein